jgi:class 3 adenylate cyclase/YHS domain-containing protein
VSTSEPDRGTFLFADIAGYTALTEAHGDADAAELAANFCRAISEVAEVRGGEVIKAIGDAVMVRHSVPSEAVALGLTAAHEVMAGHGFPAVRVGMHYGPAIEREGDWFGATVNLAARVAAIAAGGEVLVTGAVRDSTRDLAGVEFESRGEQRIRNVTVPVPLFAAVRDDRSSEARHLDPVCRMLVAEGREAGSFRHRGTLYRFCSLECARRFLGDPDAYAPGQHGA